MVIMKSDLEASLEALLRDVRDAKKSFESEMDTSKACEVLSDFAVLKTRRTKEILAWLKTELEDNKQIAVQTIISDAQERIEEIERKLDRWNAEEDGIKRIKGKRYKKPSPNY